MRHCDAWDPEEPSSEVLEIAKQVACSNRFPISMEGSERKNSFPIVLPIVVQAKQQLSSDNPGHISRHSSSQVLLAQQQIHH